VVTAGVAEVRVASRPGPDEENPYFRLMYGALASVGVRRVGAFEVDDAWLRAHATEFDAIHLHWPEWLWRHDGRSSARWIAGFQRYLALARQLGLLRIWTVHNLVPHEWQFLDLLGLLLVSRETDLFVCHSRHSERQLRQRLWPRASARTVVMPHGNYDGAYPPASDDATVHERFRLPTDKALVGLVGQVRRYKGVDTALDAIARLEDRAHLVIAGRPVGSMRAVLERAASMRSVTLVDRPLADQELSDLLSVLDVAWLPYRRITGSGALMLALTAGVPVVASDLPFFREVVEDSSTAARVVPREDAGGLAHATNDLLDIPRHERRAAARALADRYSWASCVMPLADAIRTSVAIRRPISAECA
jgi:glycosyltransferase involved in cell wall biosynthesis